MEKKPKEPIVQKEEIKKWTNEIVKAAKGTIDEVVDNIKEGSENFEKRKLAAKYEKDLLLLKPVFREMLQQRENTTLNTARLFSMPAMIHVVEKDKKHSESTACEHSLGHLSTENGIQVLNVYPHHMKDLGVVFFPNMDKEFYYQDPVQKNLFIDIQEYFQQLKVARVNELERLAYSLGAKHAEIIFKTNTVELEKAKKKAELGAKKGKKQLLDVKAEHSEDTVKKEAVEIEKVIDCSGHDDPQVPELVYFKNNEDIQQLIFMRIDNKSRLNNKECKLKYSSSSGIKASDAVKIKGALDKMGGGTAGASILNESLNESCTTLIYRIEF